MSVLYVMLILWGIVTGVLAVLLIYRSLVSMKEDDQLFLDAAAANLEREQTEVRVRLQRLNPYTKLLAAASGLLLLCSAGIWLYQTLRSADLLP